MIPVFLWSVLYVMGLFLAISVNAFSRSGSIESMIRSGNDSFWRKSPDCHSMASTRVVLPWSTWAMIAMFRMLWRSCIYPIYHGAWEAHPLARGVSMYNVGTLTPAEVAPHAPSFVRRPRARGVLRVRRARPGLEGQAGAGAECRHRLREGRRHRGVLAGRRSQPREELLRPLGQGLL